MEVVIVSTVAEAARIAADAIEHLVTSKPHANLGLATGSSPLPVYRDLIERNRLGAISFRECRAFLLDEYVGLERGHPQSYRSFIRREFTDHVDLPATAVFGPDGSGDDLASAAETYERLIVDAGGIDLQLLGVGSDGHIGFNEPASSLGSRSRLKTLTESTRSDNARFFGDDIGAVPRHVLTQGIGTILDAAHLVLLASGPAKAAPIAAAVEGPLTAMVPASALQLHPHATVIVDEPAAARLTHAAYYREAYDNKPDWQRI
jgi:glucosamine-6-phosphate deaminase